MEKTAVKNLLKKLDEKLANEKYLGCSVKDVVVGGGLRLDGRIKKPVTMPKEQFDQICALYKFLKENNNLTQEELNNLLKTKFVQYKFLRQINKKMPGLLDELKTHGPMYVAGYIAYLNKTNEELKRVLP